MPLVNTLTKNEISASTALQTREAQTAKQILELKELSDRPSGCYCGRQRGKAVLQR